MKALVVMLLLAFVAVGESAAQSVASGTIHGTVADESGAALPGVTATLASPSLQVGKAIAVSDANGNYRFVELPAGTYRVTFELAGFSTFVRDELRLNVGFTARVDVKLSVGRVEETVTVRGESPVVDLSTTSTAANFTEEELNTVPRGRDIWAAVGMTPGVGLSGPPDVGGSRMGERSSMETYGVGGQPKLQIEGINISTGADENSSVYVNYFGFDEIQFKTSGTDAEVGVPGLQMIAVLKSGGNTFHGRYEGSHQGSKLQSGNLTESLRAQGLTNTDRLKYHFDVAADLGGRLVRDKLWFYGGYNRQQRVTTLLGFAADAGPDGRYLTGDEPLADYHNSLTGYNLKLSWQMSAKDRLIGVYQAGIKVQPQQDGGRFRPLESTRDYYAPTFVEKIEYQSTLSPRMLIDIVGGLGGGAFDYSAMRNPLYPATPSRLDRETGLRTGGHESSEQRPRGKWQVDGGFSFFPTGEFAGHHELKTGGNIYWFYDGNGRLDHPHGNYVLVFDRVGGVSGQPAEIQINNFPLVPKNRQTTYAWYAKDTWRVNTRLTANLGIRFERQKSWLPDQSREATPGFETIFPAGSFDGRDVLTWNRFLPRVGLAFNLNPKTVLKTSFGLYSYLIGDDFAGLYNKNALGAATFRWRDLDGNGDYTAGEVNLDLGANPDFIGITGAANNILPNNLQQPMTTEVTASFERELRPNLGFRAAYVFRKLDDFFATPGPNVLRPASAYNIPITRRDPGADGVLNTPDDAGKVTLYDYDPAYRGAAFVGNQVTNSPESDRYSTIEVAITKRSSNRWMASASAWTVKNHRWLTRVFQSPNDDFFPLDETREWAANATASYRLPWDVQLAGFVQSKQGVRGQRSYIFRTADPDGGLPIAQSSTVTLRLEPYGKSKGPAINLVNLRASKEFALMPGRRMGLDVDIFNLLNSSAPTAITFASGPTFGYASTVLPARIVRFGVTYSF